jgi:hypothetical protein
MVSPDLLHVWHIGCGRDFVASVIQDLVEAGFWGKTFRLPKAQESLEVFCASRSLQLKTQLSRESLCLKPGEYPEVHCKGSQTIILHKWLAHLAEDDFGNLPGMELAAQMVRDSDRFLQLSMQSDQPFLSPEASQEAFSSGIRFLASYIEANRRSALIGKLRYFVRPKLHMLQHLVLMCRRQSRRSAHLDSTWMDEDFIGKIMRLLRHLHPRTADFRVLQRYLLNDQL